MTSSLALYLILLLLLGISLAKRNRREESYFLASRRAGALLVGASLLATSIGGSSLFVTADLVASYGLRGVVLEVGGALGLILLGLIFAKKVRSRESFTLAGLLQKSYGSSVRRWSAGLLTVAELLWFALLIKALSTIIPSPGLLMGTVAIVVIYTMIGGQWAVFGTDTLQVIVLLTGLSILAFPFRISGAAEYATPSIPALLTLFILAFFAHLGGSDIYTRILSARNVRSAQLGCYIAAAGKLFWGGLMLVIFSNADPGTPILDWMKLLPPAGATLLFLIILSALLSSMDTVILSSSAFLQHELLQLTFHRVKSRVLTLTLGLIGILIYLYSGTLVQAFTLSYSFFVAAFVPPLILGLLLKKSALRPVLVLVGMTAGGMLAMIFNVWIGGAVSLLFSSFSFTGESAHG